MFPGVEDDYAIIGQALADSAPDGWRRAWVTADVYDTATDTIFDYEKADGTTDWFDARTPDIVKIGEALRRIRKAMLAAGQDDWRRCVFAIWSDGKFRLDIDREATDTIV